MTTNHQVESDGKTVWVNHGNDGHNLGRFSRMGYEVNDLKCPCCGTQMAHNKSGPLDAIDWQDFVLFMTTFYHIPFTMMDSHRPIFLRSK